MNVLLNPSVEELEKLFAESRHNAAKWIRAPDGRMFFWKAEEAFHATVAAACNLVSYEKGLAVPSDESHPPAGPGHD